MTVGVVGLGVVARKPRWKQCLHSVPIPTTNLPHWATSGSAFRLKLGLAVLAAIACSCAVALVHQYCFATTSTPVQFVQSEAVIIYPDDEEADVESEVQRILDLRTEISTSIRVKSNRKMAGMQELTNPEAVEAVAKASSAFGGKLYDALVTQSSSAGDDGKNMILSPFSVEAVLAMVLAGAKGNTADQIRKGLALPAEEKLALAGFAEVSKALAGKSGSAVEGDDGYTLSAASRLFVQSGFELEDRFVATNKDVYLSEPEQVDFAEAAKAALAVINGWAKDKTMGKIKDLLSEDAVTSHTRLVLANAVYFKGAWKSKFDAAKTEKADFHVPGLPEPIKVDMMKSMGSFELDESSVEGARAIELPYKGDRMSMVVVLPEKVDGLPEVEKALADFDLAKGFNFLKPRGQVPLGLPKFRVETTHDLNEALEALGMTDMFSQRADFSGINEASGKKLSVSSVVQKAFIEVNEEGSEAAAATGAVMMLRSMPAAPARPFICNRPFVFLIKDKLTGIVLFSGRILNPTLTS